MQKTMNRLIPTMLMAAACSATSAQVVDFVFVEDGVRDLTTMTLTDPGTGLTMTVDNPRDNTMFGDNTFARILGGLFLDGGLAPTVDWTFSENVRLVEYEIANQDNTDLFTLTQGGTVSAGNTTDPIGTFAFTNTSDRFAGGTPIVLTTSDHSGGGYSFARVRVEVAQTAFAVDGFVGQDLYRIDLNTGAQQLVGNIGQNVLGMTFGPSGNRLIGFTNLGDVIEINPATGGASLIGASGLGGQFGAGLAAANGNLYAVMESDESLYEINIANGAATLIGSVGTSVAGLASVGGVLYSVTDTPDNLLVRVNAATGAGTVIGPLGFSGSSMGASASSSGTLWAVSSNGNSYTVDLGTGAGTLESSSGLNLTALAIRGNDGGPSLIGDDYVADITRDGASISLVNDTALIGPDAIGNWFNQITYDVEASTINVSSISDNGASWTGNLAFDFRDLDFMPPGTQIIGASILNAAGAGWDQIDNTDLSFTADSVTIDAAEIGSVTVALDQTITVQLITGSACPGDIADDFGIIGPDGMVSFGDFLALLGLTGPCPGGVPGCTGDIADDFGILGGDGMVSFGDFLALLGLVGPCP